MRERDATNAGDPRDDARQCSGNVGGDSSGGSGGDNLSSRCSPRVHEDTLRGGGAGDHRSPRSHAGVSGVGSGDAGQFECQADRLQAGAPVPNYTTGVPNVSALLICDTSSAQLFFH